jgi:hypothetical protein
MTAGGPARMACGTPGGVGAAEMRLLATMPLHAIASVQGQAGLRERLLIEIAGFPPHARAGRDHERGDVRGRQPLQARAVRR